MDIDNPPSLPPIYGDDEHYHILVPSFSSSFPLPFRVLSLLGLALLLWATNLHLLHLLGLQTGWILSIPARLSSSSSGGYDVLDGADSEDEERGAGGMSMLGGRITGVWARSRELFGPVYGLFGWYTAWCLVGWGVFRWASGGQEEGELAWRGLIGVTAVGVVVGFVMPYGRLWKRERMVLLQSLKRCLTSPVGQPIFFCDVITADILTSFSKVIGDFWVSFCLVLTGIESPYFGSWIVPLMTSLPYFIRLRQCIVEYMTSDYQNTRPLLNALKYASAFPVIILSAIQKGVLAEIAAERGVDDLGDDTWHGEHPLFRLWLLAVFINSFYSFWWDVTNDWGLTLLTPSEWQSNYSSLGSSLSSSSPAQPHSPNVPFHPIPQRVSSHTHKRTKSLLNRALNTLRPSTASHPYSPLPSHSNGTQKLTGGSTSSHHTRTASQHRSVTPDRFHNPPSRIALPSPSSSSYHPPSPSSQSSPTTATTPTITLHHPFHSSPHLQPTTAHPFGLRPAHTLSFPDPSLYYLFILVDLVLRFTWSLKLSSHLHTIAEIESGVFLMEGLELGRRWMWVFLRIEWEGVRKAQAEADARRPAPSFSVSSSSTPSRPSSARPPPLHTPQQSGEEQIPMEAVGGSDEKRG